MLLKFSILLNICIRLNKYHIIQWINMKSAICTYYAWTCRIQFFCTIICANKVLSIKNNINHIFNQQMWTFDMWIYYDFVNMIGEAFFNKRITQTWVTSIMIDINNISNQLLWNLTCKYVMIVQTYYCKDNMITGLIKIE